LADIKSGEPFGLEAGHLANIDWELARKRIVQDVQSDFIYAPHLNFIYAKAGAELIASLIAELKAGNYSPGVPLTIEVPKPFRIRVAAPIKRLGPNFSRPGSILLPRDRLLYQALADQAAPIVKAKSDLTRSFSHQLGDLDSAAMFQPTRVCWGQLQTTLRKHSKKDELQYILKLDVANYFGSLNQHVLINVLSDSGYPKPLYSRLEAILTSFTGERSSRGILQGMYPSDLFGNFYMAPVDKFLAELGAPSARYVDDLYIFVKTMLGAERLLQELILTLRSYDLVLNEAKSAVMPKSALITEEPDLNALFADAVQEIASQVDDEDFDADYGFQADWDDVDEEANDDDDSDDLELAATKLLFDSIKEYPGQEENIERFCLPLFSKVGSDHAVAHVLECFDKRPAMSQIFASYLAKFLSNNDVLEFLVGLLSNKTIVDWQKLWVLAALSQVKEADDAHVKAANSILRDGNRHEALRAVAAIYVGRFGDHSRRKALVAYYSSVSPYIQAAIYFSTRGWPGIERSNAKTSWGSQNPLNVLLTAGMAK
jgi:hypothetical protein